MLISDGENRKTVKKSVADLKQKFLQDYPQDKLITIPVVKLQDYSSVPHHLTEDDIRTNIEKEFDELLNERVNKVKENESQVLQIVNLWSFNMKDQPSMRQLAENLNNKLFEYLFFGVDKAYTDKCSCNDCQHRSCKLTKSNDCNTQKGFKKVSDRLKNILCFKWIKVFQELKPSQDNANFQKIENFLLQEIKIGIKKQLQDEIGGILAVMRGRNSENDLANTLELLLKRRKGVLLSGFQVKKYLKSFYDAFGIKLKDKVTEKGSKKMQDVEHDSIFITPHKNRVRVSFVQAKSQLNLPWTSEKERIDNVNSVMNKACQQGMVDIKTFADMVSHFLTEEQFKLIDFHFTITISDLTCVPESIACAKSRKFYVYEEDKGKTGPCYTFSELQTLFGDPNSQQEPITAEVDDLYNLLASIYVGGGSLISLKTLEEGFKATEFYMGGVTQSMQKAMKGEKKLDSSIEKSIEKIRDIVPSKWIARNKNIRLSPSQNNIYKSGIGLKGGYSLIGGHGSGKTQMIQLEVSRAAQMHDDQDTPANIYIVVWEMKAQALLKDYEIFQKKIRRSGEVKIHVHNKESICHLTSVQFKGKDTTSIINEVCKRLTEIHDGFDTYLQIDEIEVENPGVSTAKELIGKAPFELNGQIYSWTNLEPSKVHLIAAATSDSQDLVKIAQLSALEIKEMEESLEAMPAGKMPTAALWRVFRCTNSIQTFVEHLQTSCTEKDREFGYAVSPLHQLRGHDVRGESVEWISCPERKHMICPNQCHNCFLVMIESILLENITHLDQDFGIPSSHVTVIVSTSEKKRTCNNNLISDFLSQRHPNIKIKLDFEMEGLDAPVVIVVRNGGLLGSTISHAMSRASVKLSVISTDDNKILAKAVDKGILTLVNTVEDRKTNLEKTINDLPAMFKDDPSVAFVVGEILNSRVNNTETKSMAPKDSYKCALDSIRSYHRIVLKQHSHLDLTELIDAIDSESTNCFLLSKIKDFVLDNNTMKTSLSHELKKDIENRLAEVKDVRRLYAAIQILEGKQHPNFKRRIKEIVLLYESWKAGIEEFENNMEFQQDRICEVKYLTKKIKRLTIDQVHLKNKIGKFTRKDVSRKRTCESLIGESSEPSQKQLSLVESQYDGIEGDVHFMEHEDEDQLPEVHPVHPLFNLNQDMSQDFFPKKEERGKEKIFEEPDYISMETQNSFETYDDKESKEFIIDYDSSPPTEVHPKLSIKMKPHQKEGTQFMFRALFKEDNAFGAGCILAHSMGLGKTLQIIALLDTLLTHSHYEMKKVLVLCPASLTSNWEDEFEKWVPQPRTYNVHALKKGLKSKLVIDEWNSKGGVLVMNYQRYRGESYTIELDPDIVVCDEGHELKNKKIKLYEKINHIRTSKRIILTGTPIQNDLKEFYNIVDFAKPGILESKSTFNMKFGKPIQDGMDKNSTFEQVQSMKERLCVLTKHLKKFMNRKDNRTLDPYLNAKTEFVVSVMMNKPQTKLYQHYIDHVYGVKMRKRTMTDHKKLRNIWNHPSPYIEECQRATENEDIFDTWKKEDKEAFFNECNEMVGSKLKILLDIIHQCQKEHEKLLVFTESLDSLDVIERYLKMSMDWEEGVDYQRMDGKRMPDFSVRKKTVDNFNNLNNILSKVFLISPRTGGQGLNLTGASRVVIYDISWNPTVDLQAIHRAYRLGQKKPVFIYRLLVKGKLI